METTQVVLSLVAVVSIAGSMFASFSELSLFIVDKVKLHKLIIKDRKRSKYLKSLLERHRETLITILFINMLFNTTFTIVMSNLLVSLSIITSTIVISLLITLFGEILPKIGGYSIAERTVLGISKSVFIINLVGKTFFRFVDRRIIYPFTSRSGYLSKKDRTELVNIVKRNTKNPKIKKFIELLDMDAKEVMIPISNLVLVEADNKDVLRNVDLNFSNVLVYENDRNNIVGVIRPWNVGRIIVGNGNIKDYVEPISFVPETKKLYDMLLESRSFTAVAIVDEYGNIIGFISPEIIFDHVFKEETSKITKIGKNEYLVYGDTPISDFNEFFQTEITSQFYSTVSGFIVERMGKIPESGEKIVLDNMEMKVERVVNGKIEKIIVIQY
ncbi:MAG: CNNM domain-containing protein [Spirochaetia bacterium]|nr:CNNM domain-containing protein [Spirochaetota bacterium]MCX8096858.1 CNNM domain-containing protein [Spirochaetota bacterium]MDW8111792.1 CNNM domain-containing protein [Spirochaetia bacterium]